MNRDIIRELALEIYAFFLVKLGIIDKKDVLHKDDQELLQLIKEKFGDNIIGGELNVLKKLALNYDQYKKDNLISIVDRIVARFSNKGNKIEDEQIKEALKKGDPFLGEKINE